MRRTRTRRETELTPEPGGTTPPARLEQDQSTHDVGRAAGNQVVNALLATAQTKLEVGSAHDVCEHEADEVARRIADQLSSPGTVRRQAETGAEGGAVDPATESMLHQARGGGRLLPVEARRRMEGAFDTDFSAVRIHSGPRAAELNRRMSAKAFTLGSDIFFKGAAPVGTGRADAELLAHELTHVVQQGPAARRVRRSFEPHNADFSEITGVRIIPQGRSNKGVYDIKSRSGERLIVKFTNETISDADKFADTVMGALGIENRNVTAVLKDDPRFDELCRKLASVGGNKVSAWMAQEGSASAAGVQVMKKVQGVDMGNQLTAAGTDSIAVDKAAAIKAGGRANFNAVAWMQKPAFVKNLGRLAVADMLIGNQDRFAVVMQRGTAQPTFNPANFKIWGDGLIGAFDHDTRAFSQELFEQKGGNPDPQAWINTIIAGEDYTNAISERPMPSLGALFTDAGQKALYSEYINIIERHWKETDRPAIKNAITEAAFCSHLRKGYAEALSTVARKASSIRKAARNLSGASGGMLDPGTIDVKLAFLQAKAKEVSGKRGDQLELAMGDNTSAEKAARSTGDLLLLTSGKLFWLDPAYQQVPARPGSLSPLEKANRSRKKTGRGATETSAQQVREEAQGEQPSPAFLAALDSNIAKFSKASAGNDRRVQFALFELKLLKFVEYVTARQAVYSKANRMMQQSASWKPADLATAKTADLGGKANGALQSLENVGQQYRSQLSSGDKHQKERLDQALATLTYPLTAIANEAKRL